MAPSTACWPAPAAIDSLHDSGYEVTLELVVIMDGPETVDADTDTSFGLMLDALVGSTLVVNSPRGLRDANEKLYALRFPEVTPPTIVTADADRLASFARAHGGAVVKPIEGHGGRGVLALRPDDRNAPSIIDTMTARGRVPTAEDFRANICVGGSVAAVDLDDADRRIIDCTAPSLRSDGLVFVGIDVIDGHLSEVNVTSPTGLRQIGALSGTRPDLAIIAWIEKRVRA